MEKNMELLKPLLIIAACLLAITNCAKRERLPLQRVDNQPPPPEVKIQNRNVLQAWIPMPLDHFDPLNNQTFLMRFLYSEEFFGGDDSPIFIMVGGEWPISSAWLTTGTMFEMARENHGYMVYTEHRYYGQTLPFTDFTTENLRYLNVDQALADLAQAIGFLKSQPRFANSKVILYGGSYAANMVLWFKQRYPHLVHGTVASSGPILGEVDFTGYLEVVHDAFLAEGGPPCIATLGQGIQDVVTALQTEEGRLTVQRLFQLCNPLDYNNRLEVAYFFAAMVTWAYSGQVQGARPGTLTAFCNQFAGNLYGETPMEKVAGYATQGLADDECWTLAYQGLLNAYSQTGTNRAWYYQTCTEYGFYQTAPRSGTIFDPIEVLDVAFYVDICKQVFDERFDEAFVYDAVNRVNTVFGGLNPDVNNTINIHGTIDPWHALGVIDRDLKESSPTFLVNRASHCFDLRSWEMTDTIAMSNVKQAIKRHVASWLS